LTIPRSGRGELEHRAPLLLVRSPGCPYRAPDRQPLRRSKPPSRAVEVASRGDSVIPRAGVGTLIDQLRAGTQEQTLVDGLELQLTRREADVMKRRREGMTTREIAYELDLSDVTIRRHLGSVARKVPQARP
jgi:hypothetical protein